MYFFMYINIFVIIITSQLYWLKVAAPQRNKAADVPL